MDVKEIQVELDRLRALALLSGLGEEGFCAVVREVGAVAEASLAWGSVGERLAEIERRVLRGADPPAGPLRLLIYDRVTDELLAEVVDRAGTAGSGALLKAFSDFVEATRPGMRQVMGRDLGWAVTPWDDDRDGDAVTPPRPDTA